MINDTSAGVKPFSPDELAQLRGQQGNEFTKGIRSGTANMLGGTNNALGALGNELGFDNFARGRFRAADEYNAEAQANAPRVTSYRDVNSIRDAGDYLAGLAGNLVPSAGLGIGAGLLTGGGAIPAMLAGTAAYTLPEAGDVVGRMREAGQPIETGKAFATGVGSAALGSIVPGLVAGKLAGKAVGAAPMTMRRAGGQVLADAGLEGATETGGEAMKQLASGKTLHTLDTGALADSFVGGTAGGGMMGGVGAAGEYAHGKAGAVSQGLTDVKNATTDALGGLAGKAKAAATTAKDAAGTAKDAVSDRVEGMDAMGTLRGLWDDGVAKGRSVLDKIAAQEDIIGDAKAYAGAAGDKLKAMLAGDDGERVKAVQDYVNGLAKEHLSPEQAQAVQDWAADPGNHAKQAAVAAVKKGQDAFGSVAGRIKTFYDDVQSRVKAKSATDTKKSEDLSGPRAAVMQELVPLIAETHPDLANAQGERADTVRRDLSSGLMGLMQEMNEGKQPSSDTLAKLIDLFGPRTSDVLQATARAMQLAPDSKAWAGVLSAADAAQRDESLTSVQRKSLRPELRALPDHELRLEAKALAAWRDDKRPTTGPNADPNAVLNDRAMREGLTKRYGDKVDAVLTALEKATPREENILADESNDDVFIKRTLDSDEQDPSATSRAEERAKKDMRYEVSKKGDLYLLPEHDPNKDSPQGSAMDQAVRRMQAAYPKAKIRTAPASELGMDHPAVQERVRRLTEALEDVGMTRDEIDAKVQSSLKKYGVVAIEGDRQETAIDPHELGAVKFDKKNFSAQGNPSALPTGHKTLHNGQETELVLDAIKLTEFMEKRNKGTDDWTERDAKGRLHRTARMFMEGVAAMTDHIGKPFDIPDSLVIDKSGTKWGDVKGLLAHGKTVAQLTKEYAAATAAAEEARDAAKEAKGAAKEAAREAAAKAGKAAASLRYQVANAKVDTVIDQAFRAEGGRPSNETLRKAFHPYEANLALLRGEENLSKAELKRLKDLEAVVSVMRERLEGRRDNNASEGSIDDPNARDADPFGQVHETLEGTSRKSDAIRTNQSGLPRSEDLTNKRTVPAEGGLAIPRDVLTAARKVVGYFKRPNVESDTVSLGASHPDLSLRQVNPRQWDVIDAEGKTRYTLKRSPGGESLVQDAPAAKKELPAPTTKGATSDPSKLLTSTDLEGFAKDLDARIAQYEQQVGEEASLSADWHRDANAGGYSAKKLLADVKKQRAEIQQRIDKARAAEAKAEQGASPDPKAVAAKKAALSKEAASGDAGLLKELSTSTDAKGLQRAVEHLTRPERVSLDAALATESYGHLQTRADAGKFLADARKRYEELKAEDSRILDDDDHPTGRLPETQQKALYTLENLFGKGSKADLESFYDGIENTAKAIDTANERLGELVRGDESVRYGLLTRKYSLMGFQLHAENQYEGFPATHDSPIRHEGKFDWRAHIGKGEGNAAFGAGTYLSTAEGTHKGYKNQFTAKVAPEYEYVAADRVSALLRQAVGARIEISADAAKIAVSKGKDEAVAFVQRTLDEHFKDGPEATISQAEFDKWTARYEKLLAAIKALPESEMRPKRIDGFRPDLAPTYEVSVNIPQDRLLDWNRPLNTQSAFVQEKLRSLAEPIKEAKTFEWARKPDLDDTTSGGEFLYGGERHTLYVNSRGRTFIRDSEGKTVGSVSGQWGGNLREIREYMVQGKEGDFVRLIDRRGTGQDFYTLLVHKLGSQAKASDYLQSLGILGNVHDARFGAEKKFRNYVIYDDSKITTNYVHFSKEPVSPIQPNARGPVDRKAVKDYIERVLGKSVRKQWADIFHAGDFTRTVSDEGLVEDSIRLSIHSLNPMSAAYHESLHAFFAKLGDRARGDVADVLMKAAESAPVLNQMKRLLKDSPEALAQLSDREERAAYMYQFWASGQLTVGDHTRNVFQKVADFIRSVLGVWSNDTRALHIMDYFHRGDFAKDMGKQFSGDVVYRKLMEPGRNGALEAAKKATHSFREMGEALTVAGGQRLRDTGIPALRELADAMKLHTTSEGDDPGFIPAARAERARVMNELGAKLKGFSKESINAALESLQTQKNDPIKALTDSAERGNAYTAKAHVAKMLGEMKQYMRSKGVKVNDLGANYFPRVYDTSFISSHQKEFLAVLAKHGVADPERVMQKIMVREGDEFSVETDVPGMQNLKERKLSFIPDSELAPFMRKNLFEVLNGYVTQATRRAEWAARFKEDGSGIDALLAKAREQGATQEQLDAARKYTRAVDGTLGDTINPEARRLMGNMIVYQNIRLLPLAIFSSVVDPMGIVVRGGTVKDAWTTFKRGVKETVKNFKDTATDDDSTKLAAQLGVIDDATLVHTLGALYSQGMVGDTARKINDTFFRYNLMEQFNTSMRVGAMEAALGFLAKHGDGKASPHSTRWINELGLQAGDVKLGADGRVKLTEADGLTLEQAAKMKAAVNRWVDGAVLRPDAADKPIWMSDPHFALFAHLKQFVYSFHETILKRVAHEYEHGNYAPAMALSSYVPIMIAADLIKGLIQGGGDQPEWKQDWGLLDYLNSGVERAGLYGTGQFLVDALKDVQRGGSGVGALTGPTVEQLTDAVRVMGGRESFGHFALKSMPANALYASALGGEATDPKFAD